jgi:ABC-type transport system involved in multi-copper enzyme maturation permease subunit
MTGAVADRGGGGPIGRALGGFWRGISAVGTKELRGRMRGRRAFVVVTVYLLLLGAFAFGVDAYLRQNAALAERSAFGGFIAERPLIPGLFTGTSGLALSADIGHAIFAGMLLVETLLVLVLAPAFTTGAISLEREKGTIDLLVTTPLSTLGLVVGKLLSALGYVFLLILASVPLMAIVFVFGGVGPEDVIRAYLLLLAVAFGMGAIGLFISALTRRTQTATVLTLLVVLALTIGSAALHEFWSVAATASSQPRDGFIPVKRGDRAPQALLWLNPFVGDLDLICTTAPGGYQQDTCGYVASVTGTPYFSTGGGSVGLGDVDVLRAKVAADVAPDTTPFGFPRDTFWPRSALAFVVTGIVLTLLSAQLVAPTRRSRLLRRGGRGAPPPITEGDRPPTSPDEVTP